MNRNDHSASRTADILVVLCLLVGLALRIGNPADWSFINDELSTWAKVSYPSVVDVIDNIRAVDSHPVGMYVFVYCWTALFGVSEWAIKLPFLLMSLGAMWLIYRLGALWFSRTTGIVALACFASLQFPIWWSHIARQYQSGSFLTLAMAYCWTQLLLQKRDESYYWLGFTLFGAASMYNHYFSFIFAAIIGLSGLFWIDRKRVFKYVGAGVIMLLLFVPHIEITAYQLQNADGHLWYNIPTLAFFPNHIFYLFHYSYWCLGVAILLVIIALVKYGKKTFFRHSKQRWMALIWFLTPMLAGYWYSVYHSPILRTSHLLFSFPYLLLFLYSFFPEKMPVRSLSAIVCLILLVNTATLIITRKQYETVHTHPYEHFITTTQDFLSNHKRSEVNIILGENPLYLQYYKDSYKASFEHEVSFKEPIAFPLFKALVEENRPYLIVGSLPEAHMALAMDQYPYVIKAMYGINYEYYILSKKEADQKVDIGIDFDAIFDGHVITTPTLWEYDKAGVRLDTTDKNHYFAMYGEWGPTFSAPLKEITPRKNQFLDIAVDVRGRDSLPTALNGLLVLEVRNEQDSLILWRGVHAESQTKTNKEWQRLYLSIRLAHESFYQKVDKMKIKTFYWNREKQAVDLDRFTIKTRKGNPILYGDSNDFRTKEGTW